MQVQDNLYFGPPALGVINDLTGDPTRQPGAGPMGRVAFFNVVALAKGTANVAALQHTTAATALTLAAGTGVTTASAPDGSGRTVYVFDTPRAVSLTTDADMHTINVTIVGFDQYGQQMTQTRALGSSATTVNTTKAFKSVLSVTPDGTDGTNNVSVGSSDILGLPWRCPDAGYIVSVGWNNVLARDTGTFVKAVDTDPATATTGDVRGTYTTSAATDGAKRLVMCLHLDNTQCGPAATRALLLGVTQV